ncbi:MULTISPECIES: hypothetical protein [Streptomyces]|uniref:hypothetical protein n=1 Tax=Streptomyces TaxID=1883 RepID=UPI00237D3D47|nr:hypothetical protein [Streptomyces sp. G7(2002)]WDT59699.1 hypothetical protein NUT86_39850 [Streptomyces sp. G7(2002)]
MAARRRRGAAGRGEGWSIDPEIALPPSAAPLAERIVTLPSPSDRTVRTVRTMLDAITLAGRPVILRSLMVAARDAFPHHTT